MAFAKKGIIKKSEALKTAWELVKSKSPQANPTATTAAPQPPKPDVEVKFPTEYEIALSPQTYTEIKEDIIRQANPLIRPYLTDVIEYLKQLKPAQVVDAIEKGETIRNAYEKLQPFHPYRFSIATARGFLKYNKSAQADAKQVLNPRIVLLIFQFENPKVYEVLQAYGKQGEEWLQKTLEDFSKILGIT